MGAGGATVYRKDAQPKLAKSGTTVELDGATTTR
jgi:hypothetical protein